MTLLCGGGGGPLCVVRVVGRSGSGKTTAIESAIARLSVRGIRVLVVKSTHHYPDVPGKDSWRFLESGAAGSVLVKRDEGYLAFFARLGGGWAGFVCAIAGVLGVHAVIVEGFRGLDLPGPLVDVETLGPGEAAVRVAELVESCVRGGER